MKQQKHRTSGEPTGKTFDAAERMVSSLGPWRYLQFVVVGLLAGVIAYTAFNAAPWFSGLIGVGVGAAYFILEKIRGVI